MKNVQRTPRFMKLKKSIESCKTLQQLECLRQLVLNYHKDGGQDSGELLLEFVTTQQELKYPLILN